MRGKAKREPGGRDWAGRWHVMDEEADFLSYPGNFLISGWPRIQNIGRSGESRGEEVDIPPEPRAHARSTSNLCSLSHSFSQSRLSSPFPPGTAGLEVPLTPAPSFLSGSPGLSPWIFLLPYLTALSYYLLRIASASFSLWEMKPWAPQLGLSHGPLLA